MSVDVKTRLLRPIQSDKLVRWGWILVLTNMLLSASIILWTVGYISVSRVSPTNCTRLYYTVLHCPGEESTENCYTGWITYQLKVDAGDGKIEYRNATRGYPERFTGVTLTIRGLSKYDNIPCWYRLSGDYAIVTFEKPDKTPIMIGSIVTAGVGICAAMCFTVAIR